MFKAAEVERKIKEINLLIDLQINPSSCRASDHYFSLPFQYFSWDTSETKNVSSTLAQNISKVSKSWRQKRSVRYYIPCIFQKQHKLAV